jgi:hypothetical protein
MIYQEVNHDKTGQKSQYEKVIKDNTNDWESRLGVGKDILAKK